MSIQTLRTTGLGEGLDTFALVRFGYADVDCGLPMSEKVFRRVEAFIEGPYSFTGAPVSYASPTLEWSVRSKVGDPHAEGSVVAHDHGDGRLTFRLPRTAVGRYLDFVIVVDGAKQGFVVRPYVDVDFEELRRHD